MEAESRRHPFHAFHRSCLDFVSRCARRYGFCLRPETRLGAGSRPCADEDLARRRASSETSYTAKLLAAGPAGVARKLGEESLETVIEAVKGDPAALTRESADLLYHLLVLWAAAGLTPDAIAAELTRREGTSGIEEKRSRK